mgnify:FL=1
MVCGKIHRATVTGADLQYVGSITIDKDLLDAADILAGQQVDVVDVTNGERLTTYVIEAPAGSGTIQMNGAAAHLVRRDDLIIIMAYAHVPESVARTMEPKVVHVDKHNRIRNVGGDLAR